MSEDDTSTSQRGPSLRRLLQAASTLFLGSFKIPGWLGLAFAVFWGVPAWESKFEFWVRVAQSNNSWLAPAASVLLWPYFSPALAIVSAIYVAVVTRHEMQARAPWVAAVGWICVTAVILTFIGVVGSGAIESYIRTQIALGRQGIARDASPADPKAPGNERPLFPAETRRLTENQKRLLIQQSDDLVGLPSIATMYLASDFEARDYATQLRAALVLALVPASLPGEQFLTRETAEGGLFLEVANKDSPPAAALKLQRAFEVLDLHPKIVNAPPQFGDAIILFVGHRPILR